MDYVNLTDQRNKKFKNISGEMQRRLGLNISYAILLMLGVINTILFSLISVSNTTKNDILGMLADIGYWLFWFIVYGKEGFKTWLLNPFSIILKYIYNFLLKWCNKLYNKYKIYLLYNLLHHLLLNFFKIEFNTSNLKYLLFKMNYLYISYILNFYVVNSKFQG
ncbi:hypothetical protein KD33_11360 [Clostridium sp. NCR]|nr:hypothetical protein KD33_11360 [Clostridium sp. NCR]